MKINFDELEGKTQEKMTSRRKGRKIDIEIESPIYEKIVKSVSPHNFKQELHEIRNLITIPDSINKFLHQEIQNQIKEQEKNKIDAEHFHPTFITNKVEEYEKEVMYNSKKQTKVNAKQKKKVKESYTFKKHQCSSYLTRTARKQIDEMKETTHHPMLYPNKITEKINKARKLEPYSGKVSSKRYSIYEHLYAETARRQMKKQIKNEMKQLKKDQKPKIISKLKNYTSIYNRLDQILQKRNKKYDPHITKDLTSGIQLFKPNLNSSKNSYKFISQSLSRQKQQFVLKNSIEKENPQKKSSFKNTTSRNMIQDYKIENQLNVLDEKVINYFISIFYPDNENISEIYALKKLTKEDFSILEAFIHEIEQIENQVNDQQTTVSSQRTMLKQKEPQLIDKAIFQNKFQKFYKNLNLYDRDVLRKKVKVNKKVEKKEKVMHTHRPSINIRSSSLDNLAKGHSQHIYYV